ncbi:hypothetical protein [Ekhidna sp.]|uniref:hypothetical protein n=1 Tax=Ekhidna sp. TaxID=2608089 RepID=UPI00329974CE
MKYLRILLIPICIGINGCSEQSKSYSLVYVTDANIQEMVVYKTDLINEPTKLFGDTSYYVYGLAPSKDGRFIYFRDFKGTTPDLKKYDVKSGDISDFIATEYKEGGMDITEDGSVVYVSNKDSEKPEVYYINANGKETRITSNDFWELSAKFSPDGKRIVFSRQITSPDSTDITGNGELFIYDLVKKVETRLTDKKGFDALPDWSPDGSQVVFHGCVEGGCHIFIINSDGTGTRQITNENDNRWPRWSPDGEWIAFTSTQNEQTDIHIIKPDGSEERKITKSPKREEIAEWILNID